MSIIDGCISLFSSSDESMKYCQHYLKLQDNSSTLKSHWKTLSNFLVNLLSVTLKNTIDPFQTDWWMYLIHSFCGIAKVSIKLAWQMNICLVTLCFSLSHFSYRSAPLSSSCSSLFYPSLASLSLLFYLGPFSTQSSIAFSLSEHYRAILVCTGCPSQQVK